MLRETNTYIDNIGRLGIEIVVFNGNEAVSDAVYGMGLLGNKTTFQDTTENALKTKMIIIVRFPDFLMTLSMTLQFLIDKWDVKAYKKYNPKILNSIFSFIVLHQISKNKQKQKQEQNKQTKTKQANKRTKS